MKDRMLLKRLTLLLLCVLLLLSGVGCGDTAPVPETDGSSVVVLPLPDTSGEDVPVDGGTGDTGITTAAKPTAGTTTTTGSTVSNGTAKPAGTTRPSTGSTVSTPDEEPPESAVTPSGSAQYKGQTVWFVNAGESADAPYRKVIEAFTAETGIKVNAHVLPLDGYASQVAGLVASGARLDVLYCDNTMAFSLQAAQPLPALFDVYDGFWDPRVSRESQINGKMYFVNSYRTPKPGGYLVYYNKRIYNDNGLLSPEDYVDRGEWSYENLQKCMQQAKDLGYKPGHVDHLMLPEQMGVSLINYDSYTGKFEGTVNHGTLLHGMEFGTTLWLNGLTDGGRMADGESGICVATAEQLLYNGNLRTMDPDDLGAVPMPDTYEGEALPYTPSLYRGYGIGKMANFPEASYYFLRYYLDLENYDDPTASLFPNAGAEKLYRKVYLIAMKNRKPYYEHLHHGLNVTGNGWSSAKWTAVRHCIPSQFSTEMGKMQGAVNQATDYLNAAIKKARNGG